jgi:hypothetical protein
MKKQTLRLPDALHDALAVWAAEEQRSLHSQIVWLLRRAVDQKKGGADGAET